MQLKCSLLKAFSCGIEGELRNSAQARQGKTNHCKINVLLSCYTVMHLNKTSERSPLLPLSFHTHKHMPSMKISSIWLCACSLYPKASFPPGSLREPVLESGEKQKNRYWESKERRKCIQEKGAKEEEIDMEVKKKKWWRRWLFPHILPWPMADVLQVRTVKYLIISLPGRHQPLWLCSD